MFNINLDDVVSSQLSFAGQECINALKTIQDDLLYNTRQVHFERHFPKIIKLLASTNNNIRDAVTDCIRAAVEVSPRYVEYLMKESIVNLILHIFNNMTSVTAAENTVHIIYAMSKYNSNSIAQTIEYDRILDCIHFNFSVVEKRLLASTLVNLSQVACPYKLVFRLNTLQQLCDHPDKQISTHCLLALINIANNAPYESISNSLVHFLANKLMDPKLNNINQKILSLLERLAYSINLAAIIYTENTISYEKLLFSNDYDNSTISFQKDVLQLIITLLPYSEKFKALGVKQFQKHSLAHAFASTIQPTLRKVILEKPLDIKRALISYGLTVSTLNTILDDEILNSLISFSIIYSNAPFILALLSSYEKLTNSSEFFILQLIKKVKVPRDITEWYHSETTNLERKLSTMEKKNPFVNLSDLKLNQIAELIKQNKITTFQFLLGRGTKICAQLLTRNVHTPSVLNTYDISTIAQFSFSLVSILPLPYPHYEPTVSRFVNTIITPLPILAVDTAKNKFNINASMIDSVLKVKGLIEQNLFQKNSENLILLMNLNPELSFYVRYDQNQIFDDAHLPILYQVFQSNRYPQFQPQISFNYFIKTPPSPIDSISFEKQNIISIFSSFYNSFSEVINGHPVICFDLKRTTPYHENFMAQFPSLPKQFFTDLLDLLKTINDNFGINIITQSFVSRVHEAMSHPTTSIGWKSYALTIIFKYPFLFPLHERLLAHRLITFDTYHATRRLISEFHSYDIVKFQAYRPDPLKLQVRRDNLFYDGLNIINFFCCHKIEIDVQFVNETGIGTGPTHEFFFLLSREFVKSENKLFLSETRNSTFCYHKNGLFPRPFASDSLYKTLGILVAKAMTMECNLDLAFNPAFFSYLQGNVISLEQIDPILASSLKHCSGLYNLDFTFPGYPEIELIANGSEINVNQENVMQYIALINNFATNEGIISIKNAFLSGFNSIFPFESLSIFSPQEIVSIIEGNKEPLTNEDLHKYFEISHGYLNTSPQVEMLFETICEMNNDEQKDFLRFVIGSPCLPIGGLRGIEPKLSVVKKDIQGRNPDFELPISSTCTHILKLPEYSSKAILKEKLLLAIKLGNHDFGLS